MSHQIAELLRSRLLARLLQDPHLFPVRSAPSRRQVAYDLGYSVPSLQCVHYLMPGEGLPAPPLVGRRPQGPACRGLADARLQSTVQPPSPCFQA